LGKKKEKETDRVQQRLTTNRSQVTSKVAAAMTPPPLPPPSRRRAVAPSVHLIHCYKAAFNKSSSSPCSPSPYHPASGCNDTLGVVEELESLLDVVVLVQAPGALHAV